MSSDGDLLTQEEPISTSDGALSDSVRAFAARGAMFPFSAVASLILVHLLIGRLGTSGYAVVALVVGLPLLLPFSDLGVGAAVITAGAGEDADGLLKTLISAVRILLSGTVVMAVVSIVLGSLGLWSRILGIPASGNLGVTLGLVIFGCTLPTGVGQRLLLARRKNHVNAVLQGLTSIVSLGLAVVALAFSHQMTWVVVAVMLGPFLVGLCAVVLGFRASPVHLGAVVHMAFLTTVRGAKVRATATSMFVISVALPVAYQADRIILAHVSDLRQVALYSAAMQLFAPCFALVAIAGETLWPSFVRAAQVGRQVVELRRFLMLFTLVGLIGFAGFAVLGRPVAAFVTGGRLHPSLFLMGSFGVLLLAQSIQIPAGMYLTNGKSLMLQAWACGAMAVLNVFLSVVFAWVMGAPGPVVASVIAILVALYPAYSWALLQRGEYGPTIYAGAEPA